MFKFIMENKWKAILSSIVIMVPALVGIVMWDSLPNQMVTHFGGDMVADGTSSKAFAVFGLPLILLAVHWIAIALTCLDKGNQNQNNKAMSLLFWILPVISLISNGTVYSYAYEKEFNFEIIVLGLIGIMFIAFGNYMPKISMNSTFGIKLPWTFANEENWNKTHRLGGKVWVASGFMCLFAMLLPGEVMVAMIVVALAIAMVVPTFYSYNLYKKQMKKGTHKKNGLAISNKISVIGIIIGVLVLVVAAILMFTGDIEYSVEDEGFNIEASYWDDLYVSYDDIESIELREKGAPGTRSNGFGSPRLSMGTFKNAEFGHYTRYTYTNQDMCIVLSDGDEILVIGDKADNRTKVLYEELKGRI